jgi:hypothetical protein
MAVMHRADLRPTKLELLEAWLPSRGWFQSVPGAELERVSSCRFDDPAGEVGIEMMLVRSGAGPIHHVPLTYRGAPLAGGEAWLVGTCEHSVLGSRWVYDGCGDPVYAAALASAIYGGTGQAEEFVETDGTLVPREPAMTVTGSGVADEPSPVVTVVRRVRDDGGLSRIVTDSVDLTVARTVPGGGIPGAAVLTGRWDGLTAPAVLAWAS